MVNRKARELTFPHATAPARGTVTELAPGVKWLRMALPFALDHINLWLLRDHLDGRDGWCIVDCGMANDDTRAAWLAIFDNALEGLPVLRVVVTHMHPDHIGCATFLTDYWSTVEHPCLMAISATDYNVARMIINTPDGDGGSKTANFYTAHGISDEDTLATVRGRSNYYASMVPSVPQRYRRLMDGQVLRIGGVDWHCISGYGHAPEHIALHCPTLNLLIAGDMVLPRISTNVMVMDVEPEANPLRLFLDSIERFRPLPQDTLVLPSHGLPFIGLHKRIDQLQEHHDERLQMVMDTCAKEPMHAAALLPLLFHRALDKHQTSFAIGEAIAHLHLLWHEQKLTLQVGGDGVRRFSVA
jgi:glyoxylase-like metal-dependent hydrolase (beta-lactamase superfamily II)